MSKGKPLIIAHRGASGYLPEHTLEAKALAVGLGADYLEQDVVATRDDQLVVLHDVHLDRVTDVAMRFPSRHRPDGRFYARDFDLDELKSLNVHERENAYGSAVYPTRFPTDAGRFHIATLKEEIELALGLARSTGRTVGLYPEIKRPAWHREEGIDLSRSLLGILDEYGLRRRSDAVFVQCFDAVELHRVRHELGCDLKLIQLLGENRWAESETDYDRLKSADGLRQLAETVDGIGPWIEQLYSVGGTDDQPISSGLTRAAHAAGLAVHPYTFRADALAPGFASFDAMVAWFVDELMIDGLFTDFPDLTLNAINGTPKTPTNDP